MKRKPRLSWTLPESDNIAAGVAFGSYGELLQGALPGQGDFLVTLPIEKHSVAHFVPSPGSDTIEVFPRWKTKSQKLARDLLRKRSRDTGGQLFLASEIPCGKGLSSSSADLLATARAIEAYLGTKFPLDELCWSLSQIEPTDGVMFAESVAYLHLKGALLERLGSVAQVEILSLDEGGQLPTLEYHQRGAAQYSPDDMRRFQGLLDRLRRGFEQDKLDEIGAVATTSAYISQRFNPKKHLEFVHAVCERTGGEGLVTTHSGTCLGILYDTRKPGHIDNRKCAAAELSAHGQVEVYATIKQPLERESSLDWSRFDRT